MEETNSKTNKIECSSCKDNDTPIATSTLPKRICNEQPNPHEFHIGKPSIAHLQSRMDFMKAIIDKNLPDNWKNFDWTDVHQSSGSKLLKLIYNLLNGPFTDNSFDIFLTYMSKAILTDQYHDFMFTDPRLKFNKERCNDLKEGDTIIGLRGCLKDPLPFADKLSQDDIDDLSTNCKYDHKTYLSTPTATTLLKEYVQYMITDTKPSSLLEEIKDVTDIYTIARFIDSAPCKSNITDYDKLSNYGVPNKYEYIITNLALAFYQSFFKELNDFNIYIDCNGECTSQHKILFTTTKMFTIIICYKNNPTTHKFNGQGGEKGDFTVPRITRTLAVSTLLCTENYALKEWLRDTCKLNNKLQERVIINLHTLMKGFGDFCQMFMCLFLYFIRISYDDGAGNINICKLNKNIILATIDTYLINLAQLCNCPYILGSSVSINYCKLYINSDSTYLNKSIIECWNKIYSIELINNGATSSLRKERSKQTFKDNNYCFCNTTPIKFNSGEAFVNNFLKNIIEYCENLVIFEKEFAILQQTDNKSEIILYLSPEDIRFTTLSAIIEIYRTNPLHSLTSTQKITFTLNNNYDINTLYTEGNIKPRRAITTELYAFFDLILTANATCKFYENIFTIKNIGIPTSKSSVNMTGNVQIEVANKPDIPSTIKKINLISLINATQGLLELYFVKLKGLTPSSGVRSSGRAKSGPVAELPEINFNSFITLLNVLNLKSDTVDYDNFFITGIFDPIIAFAKWKDEYGNGKKSKDKHADKDGVEELDTYYSSKTTFFSKPTMEYVSLKQFLTNYAKKFRMYKDLLSNMKKQKDKLSIPFPSLIVTGPQPIIDQIKTDLDTYIVDIETNIAGLETKYNSIAIYIEKIKRAKTEFDKIFNYIKIPPAELNDTIKKILNDFQSIFKDADIILKDMFKNITIIEGTCLDICDEDCGKNEDDPPGGPSGMSVDTTSAGPSGKGGGYNKLMEIEQLTTHKQLTKIKKYSKKTFKGGVNLEEALNSYPDLLIFCENYELNKDYLKFLKNKEKDLLNSDRFCYILLSNDMLVDMNLKIYSHRLFYNYFTYILIWIFTRYLEYNIDKFRQFVECYRLLIIEKHLQLSNFVNMYFYYFNKSPHPVHKLDADNLLDLFKKYEAADLINLEHYYTDLNILRQNIIDFPHKFNEFIKVSLNLEDALPHYDMFQSQYGDNPEVILNNMIPIYIGLFESHAQMYTTWVNENYVLNLSLLQNANNMPTIENIADTIRSILKLKRSEFNDLEHKIKSLDNKIRIIDTKINKPRNTKNPDKNPAKGGKIIKTHHIRAQTRKQLTRTVMQPINGKNVRLMKELNSFKTEIKSKYDKLEKLNNDIIYAKTLLLKLDRLSLIIEKYQILNTHIETNYFNPETLSTIGKNLHSINNYILTPRIIKHIYDTFNEFNNMRIKHIKKKKLSKKITNIDAKITAQKAKIDNPEKTQRAKKTAKEEQRKETRLTNIKSRKKLTKTNAQQTTDAEKVKLKEFNRLYKLKELKRIKKLEYAEMSGGVHTVSKSHANDKTNEKVSLSKYKLRVEQYKNKEFTSYFEKKLKKHINDPTVDIYKIGIRKMQSILKNIYNIAK